METIQPACSGTCSCGGAADEPQFVYALGRIEPRFPDLSLERECGQAASAEACILTDRQALHNVLTAPANRYLARRMTWIFAIECIDTYVLLPRDAHDLDLLVASVRPAPKRDDIDVVVGTLGPIAPPGLANGLALPTVRIDQIYSFDEAGLVGTIPRPADGPEGFSANANEALARVRQLADNSGSTDEHRAVNYLALRDPRLYEVVARQHAANFALTEIGARPSPLAGLRKVVEVVLAFRQRQSGVVEKQFARVDVTGRFPFLVTPIQPFYER